MPVTDNTLTDSLIALKSHYELALTETETNTSQIKEQLLHVNALLLNQLLQGNGVVPQLVQMEAEVPVVEAIAASAPSPTLSPATEAPPRDTPKLKDSPRKPKALLELAPVLGKRNPRPLLPAYAGLTRLEAIAQLLQATSGQDVTIDQISEGLFGTLSAADHRAERKSLSTQLYKGQRLNLWQTGTASGAFTIDAPTTSKNSQPSPKAPAPKAKVPAKPLEKTATQRKSLPMLPAYGELTKREAIAKVLTSASGQVLHHDTIIQALYGDLSLEELKEERVRIKTALLTGVKDGKWQKAFEPSSYFIKANAAIAKPTGSGRQSKAQTTKAEAAIAPINPPTPAAKSAKKRISLTVLPTFEGMTKLDAIAAVLGQNLGEALHQDTIIQMLYGDLSLEDLKKERVRMDTCLRNGVKTNKWKKATVAASYILETTATGSKAKNSGRKPGPSEKSKPQPVGEGSKALHREYAPATVKTPITKAKAAAKPKSAIAETMALNKKVEPKKKGLELVAILKQADIQP